MNIATKEAKFNIGQLVRHAESGYRGVIVDIDPEFSAVDTDQETADMVHSQKEQPWYHVLLDDHNMQAYIAEKQLQRDSVPEPINHDYVDVFFSGFEHDHYVSRRALN
jgi:heat shock protein HspQ